MPLPLDHLVWGGLNIQAEVERLERWTGVRARLGGQHPGEGTCNAVLRLGPAMYLELIAPDLTQSPPPHPRWFGLDALIQPRLITWAAKGTDLEQRAASARAAGVPLGEVRRGRRQLRSGEVLSWQLTYPDVRPGDGLVPFLIDWGNSPHPAETAPEGIHLIDLHAEHPEAAAITRSLQRLGLDLRVHTGARPVLVATLDTPRGRVELR